MASPRSRLHRLSRTAAILLFTTAAASLGLFLYLRWVEGERGTVAGWSAVVSTFAGDGTPGFWNGAAPLARFSDPFGVAVDQTGAVYVTDAGDSNSIRRVDPAGWVGTVTGGIEGFTDGESAEARFHTPSGLAIDAEGRLYVADTGNHAIRAVSPHGQVTTFAGDGTPGHEDGEGRAARFNGPVGVAVHPDGSVLVADTYNDRIRRISPGGFVTTIAGGSEPGYVDGSAADARFDTPCGIAVAPDGTVLVADTGNSAIRAILPSGEVTTLQARWAYGGAFVPAAPMALAVTRDGFVYASVSGDGMVVQIAPDGTASSVAGDAYISDERRRLTSPAGIALGDRGTLYVADPAAYLIHHLAPDDPNAVSAAELDVLPRLPWNRVFADLDTVWPVEPGEGPEVTGTLGEVRGGPAEGRFRLHAGLDVHAPQGSPVRAIRDEKVRAPINTWRFGTDNEGMRVDHASYVHFNVGRTQHGRALNDPRFVLHLDTTGKPYRVRVRRGTRFQAGDVLGTINRLRHVHLEVGPAGAPFNPLRLSFPGFRDDVAPTIVRGGVWLYDAAGQRLGDRRKGRLLVRGDVSIVVEAYDQVDNNRPGRRLGLYELGYSVLRADGTPAPGFENPRITLVFDRLPRTRYAAELVYAPGSGIAAHRNPVTRFRYIVTNNLRDGVAEAGAWDSSALPPGDYILRIVARDIAGNEAKANRDFPITIVADPGTT
jgi:sugar lactone lactonase YvrE/murein DD-endopeptidase MepM/ murein hydrolase activator NlpD